MTGALRANYGFEAGVANNRILEICSQDITPDADGAVTAVEYGVKNYRQSENRRQQPPYRRTTIIGLRYGQEHGNAQCLPH